MGKLLIFLCLFHDIINERVRPWNFNVGCDNNDVDYAEVDARRPAAASRSLSARLFKSCQDSSKSLRA